jgi:hypothetical protein
MLRKSLKIGLFAVMLALSAGAARADFPETEHAQFQTRFGLLSVVGDYGSQRILLGAADLGISDARIAINGVWTLQDGTSDWAVLTTRHGGNMCGGVSAMYILRLSAGQVARTDGIGGCAGGPIGIRVYPDAVELDLFDSSAFVSHRVYRFDGTNLTETPVAVTAATTLPSGGADVLRWLQTHPHKLTQDPTEQARFAQIMSRDQFSRLNEAMTGPGGTDQRGGWIVGRACRAHLCNVSRGVWALRISDGKPMAVLYEGVRSQVFGTDLSFDDPTIRELLEETMK